MQSSGLSAALLEERIEGPAHWTIERDAHLLILHEAGGYHRLETWLDGRRTSLGDPLPGEMWFVPAGRRYRGAARGGAVRYAEVEIPADRLSVAPGARALAGHNDRALAALVRALVAGESGAARPLLAILARTFEGNAGRAPSAATARRIDALLAFIEAHIEMPLTVEHMAAEAGMSVNSLIVHFARATGRTPGQYLLHQRLRRARWYLANRPLSVAEIAFATGFSSHAHLCATFRAKLGLSPGEWRRRHAAAALSA
ncbi:MAG TPA: helix-turn-helix domain-containing protein [Sphingopyxis sp.]|nr:helix-turn-helix domain-containing protein [Sphingopyxis sp.]